jgi:hypothetical protein
VARKPVLAQFVRFHNAYVRYVAFFLLLVSGARQCAVLDWRASFRPGHWFTHFSDKLAPPIRLPLPMLVSSSMANQLAFYLAHCHSFMRRLSARQLGSDELRRRLLSIGAAEDVTLLFRTDPDGSIHDVGTSWVLDSLPNGLELAPDVGRHFFGSHLHHAGVPAALIDFYLRHAELGVEPLSSTSMVSLRAAWKHVCPQIDSYLESLGVRSLPGLRRVGHE